DALKDVYQDVTDMPPVLHGSEVDQAAHHGPKYVIVFANLPHHAHRVRDVVAIVKRKSTLAHPVRDPAECLAIGTWVDRPQVGDDQARTCYQSGGRAR